MKTKLPILLAALLLIPALVRAGEVTLAWDPNTEPDLAGYRIHYGIESGAYTQTLDVGNVLTTKLTGLEPGVTYYAVATAYNTGDLESGYSSEISFLGRPAAPQGLRVVTVTITVQVDP